MGSLTVEEMISTLNVRDSVVEGDFFREFDHPADVWKADSRSISFFTGKTKEGLFPDFQGTVITDRIYNCSRCTIIVVNDPRKLFIRILNKYFFEEATVSVFKHQEKPEFSVVSNKVVIGKNVSVDPGCVIGFDGFSYERQDDGTLEKFLHYGGVIIEDNVEIGSNTSIDRGTFGDTIIGKGTKIDNLCHIAHNVVIGRDCLIVAHAGIGGGVKIGDRCFIGLGALIRDGITIGSDCMIGMGAVVVKDVTDGKTVMGNPAREIE